MPVQNITDEVFNKELEGNEKVVLKYYADWCGSCRLISPKIARMSESEKYSGIKFFEVDAEKNPQARKWAGVTNLPFFAVVENGLILASDSTSKVEKVEEMIDKLV